MAQLTSHEIRFHSHPMTFRYRVGADCFWKTLFQNYIFIGNIGTLADTEWSDFVNYISIFLRDPTSRGYEKDNEWIEGLKYDYTFKSSTYDDDVVRQIQKDPRVSETFYVFQKHDGKTFIDERNCVDDETDEEPITVIDETDEEPITVIDDQHDWFEEDIVYRKDLRKRKSINECC